MKKIYFSLIALAFAGSTFAQSQRLVVVEEFTQASCPPCAAQNPAFNTLLDANTSKVVAIKYQTSWPGVDPMNAHNPTDVQTRVTYYAVSGVPTATLDAAQQTGGSYTGAPANFTQAKINARYAITSPLTMDVSHTFSPGYDTIHVHAVITKTGTITSTNVKVRLAVIERHINFATPPGTNGETEFEGVMKKMLPNAGGTTLNTPMIGDSMVLDFSWKLANIYDYTELAVVGFVQDDAATNKQVLQGGYSQPKPISLDGSITAAPGTITCNTNFSSSFYFVNKGTMDITSADFNYALAGGSNAVYSWNGLVLAGDSTLVTLPAVTLQSNGTNTLNVSIAQVNGQQDFPLNNSSVILIPAALTSVVAPVTQDYTATTWPPAEWNLTSATNTNWKRSVALGVSAAKCDFFNYNAGAVSDMVTPKVDLTPTAGQTSATLDFDLAYRQSTAAFVDELQILVSTDCGATWTNVWDQSGATLASVPTYSVVAFTPSAAQYKHAYVDMTPYLGNANVLVSFHGISASGNNLYIDNVNLHFGAPTGIADLGAGEYLKLYPNPSKGLLNVDAKFSTSKSLNVTVTDLVGNVVYTNQYAKSAAQHFTIDLTNQSNGTYFVKFENENGVDIEKVNILK